MKIDVNSGNITAIGTQGEIEWHTAAERRYIFDHIWLHAKMKFYDPSIHNVDWELYYKTYVKFLPHISNNFDFEELQVPQFGGSNKLILPYNSAFQ